MTQLVSEDVAEFGARTECRRRLSATADSPEEDFVAVAGLVKELAISGLVCRVHRTFSFRATGGSLGAQLGLVHSWGLPVNMLPGGRLVYGEAIWSATPHPAATAPLAGRDDEYLTQDALREQIRAAGFEVVDDDQASVQEWDVFEAGYRDRFTRWLQAHDADHPAAEQVRQQYEEQRAAFEEGYRGVLGMAYFCLRG